MKLQRYDVKDGGYEKAAEFGTYCLSDDVEKLEAENAQLKARCDLWNKKYTDLMQSVEYAAITNSELNELRAENTLLRELLGAWYSDVSIPGPNCSCHISPPCNDCVEWGGLREAAEQTKRILGVKS